MPGTLPSAHASRAPLSEQCLLTVLGSPALLAALLLLLLLFR